MAFAATFARPIFFVRWTSPRMADVPRVTSLFNRAYESMGAHIVYIAIVPEDCVPPDDTTRKSLTKGGDEALDRCLSMHIVLEGQGFRTAILRNALAGMLLLGKRRDKLVVHKTVDEALDEALRRVPPDLKFDKRSVYLSASKAGVVSVVAPKGVPGAAGGGR